MTNAPTSKHRRLALWAGAAWLLGPMGNPVAAAGADDDATAPVLPAGAIVERLSKDIVLDEPTTAARTRQRPRVAAEPKVSLRLHFAFGSSLLQTQGQRQLDQLALALSHKDLSSYAFELAGHTDSVGSHAMNMQLSLERANAAKTYLVQTHGLLAERLLPIGFGFTRLADRRDPRSGANRRVEVRRLRLGSAARNLPSAAPVSAPPGTDAGTLVLTPKTPVQ